MSSMSEDYKLLLIMLEKAQEEKDVHQKDAIIATAIRRVKFNINHLDSGNIFIAKMA
jgi:hypothetical protein